MSCDSTYWMSISLMHILSDIVFSQNKKLFEGQNCRLMDLKSGLYRPRRALEIDHLVAQGFFNSHTKRDQSTI